MIYRFLFLAFIVFSGCSSQNEEHQEKSSDSLISREKVTVTSRKVIRKTFISRIITNGKVISSQEIPLSFQVAGLIAKVNISNGDKVTRGQLLAALINDGQQLALREALLQKEESEVELDDQLITQGGKRGDSTSVSRDVYAYIKLRSGYNRAKISVEKARFDLSKTHLYAPLDGIIANLKQVSFGQVVPDAIFCTLINRSKILILCQILESELPTVRAGQTANIQTGNKVYKGRVGNINPMVSADGLVEVTLQVQNPDELLLSGLNVRVDIEKSFPGKITVPKEALIERNGRKLVFLYDSGRAKWQYVITGQESDKEVIIEDGLKGGEEVIISGNLNLAHNTEVERKM